MTDTTKPDYETMYLEQQAHVHELEHTVVAQAVKLWKQARAYEDRDRIGTRLREANHRIRDLEQAARGGEAPASTGLAQTARDKDVVRGALEVKLRNAELARDQYEQAWKDGEEALRTVREERDAARTERDRMGGLLAREEARVGRLNVEIARLRAGLAPSDVDHNHSDGGE